MAAINCCLLIVLVSSPQTHPLKTLFSSIKDFITVYKVQNILLAQLDYLSMSILLSGCSEVIKISPNFILVNSVEHFKQSLVFFNWQSSCSCKCMNVGNITCLFGGFSNSCKCTTQLLQCPGMVGDCTVQVLFNQLCVWFKWITHVTRPARLPSIRHCLHHTRLLTK
jgi:hypothetical protein